MIEKCPYCGAKAEALKSGAIIIQHDRDCWIAENLTPFTLISFSDPAHQKLAEDRWNRRVK